MPRRGAEPAPGSEVGDAMGRLYARGDLRCERRCGYDPGVMSDSARPSTPALLPIRPRAFSLRAAPWGARLDVETALLALEDRRGLVCLDSAGGAPARWSLIAFDPLVSFEGAAAPADLDGLAAELARRKGKQIPVNLAGAIAAVLADLGFEPLLIGGLGALGYGFALLAHIVEEVREGVPLRIIPEALGAHYAGPEERHLPAGRNRRAP